MKSWETQLLKHILNEKFLQEDETPELQKEDKKAFLQAVANYHRLGEIVYAKRGLKEVAKTVQNIVEKAEALTMQESEHWFDNVTVSRHMKQLKEAHKVFEKTSTEMTGLQQRLEAAYDDMGSILGRYYKVGTALNENDDEIPESTVNEGKSQKWIVFLPIKRDNIIDIDDSLFGVYNDEEYDRIAPFDKVENYTTSLSFADMKTAKEFEELVRKAKGNTKSSAYSKATELEKKNKI